MDKPKKYFFTFSGLVILILMLTVTNIGHALVQQVKTTKADWSLSATNQTSYDIAFVSTHADRSGIYVMRGDGSNRKLLLAEATALLTPSSWSPDGKKIAYLCGAKAAELFKKYPLPMHFALCLVNADGSGRERLLDVPVLPFFRWSPDSQRVVFSSGYEDPARDNPRVQRGLEAGSVAIYMLDLNNRRTTRLTPLGQNGFPSWSPDGHRIVFSGDVEAANQDIYVVDADGSKLHRLTRGATVDVQPAWSPRGDLIAFVAAPRAVQITQESGVVIVRPDGSGAKRISSALARDVAWSPDSTQVLVASGLASSPDMLIDVATGAATELVRGALDGTFAPDGRNILYRSRDDGDWSLYTIDVQGQNRKKLMDAISTFSVSPLLRRKR